MRRCVFGALGRSRIDAWRCAACCAPCCVLGVLGGEGLRREGAEAAGAAADGEGGEALGLASGAPLFNDLLARARNGLSSGLDLGAL
jgi:hypothetical protein